MYTTEAPLDSGQTIVPPKKRAVFARYVFFLVLPLVLAYLSTLALVMVPAVHYERWGTSEWGPILEYPFRVQHQNADVVIFGDSSAFLGIDPRLVNEQLHIHSLVLPNTIGSLPLSGDMSLDEYLSHNTPPRLLVLYFAPWDLDYRDSVGDHFLFEGEEMLLHNGSLQQVFAFARRKPLELLAFPLRVNSTLSLHSVLTALRDGNREQTTARALGHVDYHAPLPPIAAPCLIPSEFVTEHRTASVQALIRRYSTPQTRVVVYLAPVPGCTNAPAVVHLDFGNIAAKPPSILPPNDFSADGSYAHLLPSSVATASTLFAQALRLDLAPQSAPPPSAPTYGHPAP
jgi:hypothetical protein